MTAAVGDDGSVEVHTDDEVGVLHALTGWALQAKVDLVGLTVSRTTLEDVYLRLTAGEEPDDERPDHEGGGMSVSGPTALPSTRRPERPSPRRPPGALRAALLLAQPHRRDLHRRSSRSSSCCCSGRAPARRASTFLGNIKLIQYYVPGFVAYGVMAACFSTLAISLVFRRETGLLKRLRLSPLPAWALLGADLREHADRGARPGGPAAAVGRLGFGVHLPTDVAAFVLALLVGVFAFTALGVAMSTLIPTTEAAGPLTSIVFFVLLFLSGPVVSAAGRLDAGEDLVVLSHPPLHRGRVRALQRCRAARPGPGTTWRSSPSGAPWAALSRRAAFAGRRAAARSPSGVGPQTCVAFVVDAACVSGRGFVRRGC